MRFNRNNIFKILKSPAFSIFLILLFHVSGLIGLQTSSREWFLALTPLNLLVSFVALFIHEDFKNRRLIFFILLILCAGFLIEVIGVNTGLVFGQYAYGPVLGFKIFNTPLMIGFNWLILVFCVGLLLGKIKLQTLYKSLIGALIMTLCDYIIEPVAIGFNFWTWQGGTIPIQNYIAWYLFSLLFLFLFYRFKIESTNKVASWLLATQIIFFLSLNLLNLKH